MDYIKLTTENNTHNGYQYKEGLNCLDGEFNNKKVCGSGGLYFCRKEDIGKWTFYNYKQMHYIWDVKLCEDSKIVDMGDKLKTDKFILSNKRSIWDNKELCKLSVSNNGNALEFVKPEFMSYEICKLAVQQSGYALQYVPSEFISYEICKLAVQRDGYALKYVPPGLMNEEICKLAFQENGYTLRYVSPELMNEEICKLAVQQDGYALQYVPPELMNKEICKLAVQNTLFAIPYIKCELITDEIRNCFQYCLINIFTLCKYTKYKSLNIVKNVLDIIK